MRAHAIVWGAVVGLTLSGTARAGYVTFTDVNKFRAAAGIIHEINFELLPDGSPSVDDTPITPEFNYTDQGVTFSSPFPELSVAGEPGYFALDSQFAETTGRNWIIADLVTPATAVGIFVPGNTTLSVFDSDDLLIGSASLGGTGGGLFLGIVSDVPIARAIEDRGSSGEIMESFLFTPIPEPTTLLLLFAGSAGVFARRVGGSVAYGSDTSQEVTS